MCIKNVKKINKNVIFLLFYNRSTNNNNLDLYFRHFQLNIEKVHIASAYCINYHIVVLKLKKTF